MGVPICPIHHRPMMAPKAGNGPYFCPAKDPSGPKGYCSHKAYPDPAPAAAAPAPPAPAAPTPPPAPRPMVAPAPARTASTIDCARFETLAVGCLQAALQAYAGEGSLDESWHERVLFRAREWFHALRDDIEVLP